MSPQNHPCASRRSAVSVVVAISASSLVALLLEDRQEVYNQAVEVRYPLKILAVLLGEGEAPSQAVAAVYQT